mgnify:CR=1 FL=1
MKTNWMQITLTVLLVGAAFAIGMMWTQLKILKTGRQPTPSTTPQAQAPQPEAGQLSDELWQAVLAKPAYSEGDEQAKVIMVEFTDYQCPFCKRHFDQTAKQIETEYIKTGKIRWVLRDLPLSFHQNAHLAAQAARCAGDQNKYKVFHDKLFETQTAWAENDSAKTLFSGYANNMGLNSATFNQCLTSGKYKTAVDEDLDLASQIGANGTPTFYVNGKPLVGAQPFSAFKAVIDAELK